MGTKVKLTKASDVPRRIDTRTVVKKARYGELYEVYVQSKWPPHSYLWNIDIHWPMTASERAELRWAEKTCNISAAQVEKAIGDALH